MKNAVATREELLNAKSVSPRRYTLLDRLHAEMTKLFEDFAPTTLSWPDEYGFGEPIAQCSMKVDVKDTDKEIIVTAEIPGVSMDDLQITATPHYLSVAGEKRQDTSEHDKNFYKMERSYGWFRRVIHTPCEIQKDKVDAVYKDGVLTVTLPKSKAAIEQEHKVTVKAG